jgi:hypothetical protein
VQGVRIARSVRVLVALANARSLLTLRTIMRGSIIVAFACAACSGGAPTPPTAAELGKLAFADQSLSQPAGQHARTVTPRPRHSGIPRATSRRRAA